MNLKNEQLLQQLANRIETLATQIQQIEQIELFSSCFDEHLFKQYELKDGYAPYLQEVEYHFQQLKALMQRDDNQTQHEQIEYISDLLANQIIALQRELATYHLRQNDKPTYLSYLNESHAKNLKFLRRLEFMYSEAEAQPDDHIKQHKLAVLSQRIARCKEAINDIEKKMT
ncbi:primosomal replication protein PriC [Orbaceae bacterium ac157xtp]